MEGGEMNGIFMACVHGDAYKTIMHVKIKRSQAEIAHSGISFTLADNE